MHNYYLDGEQISAACADRWTKLVLIEQVHVELVESGLRPHYEYHYITVRK